MISEGKKQENCQFIYQKLKKKKKNCFYYLRADLSYF